MNRKFLLTAVLIITVVISAFALSGCFADKTTISFDSMGGNSVSSISIDESTTQLSLPTPIKEGYQFDYWCYDVECANKVDTSVIPTESVTFYAKWTAKLISITFMSIHPVTGEVTKQFAYVPYNGTLSIADMPSVKPEIDGYEGYWLTENLQNVKTSITINAAYRQKKYSVTYYVDGEVYKNYEGLPNAVIEVPAAPSKAGYYFNGWYYEKEGVTRCKSDYKRIPKETVTLYAVFADVSETLRFFNYTSGSGVVKITGLTSVGKAQSSLVVPATIDNNVVTSIGYNSDLSSAEVLSVFKSDKLQSIVIPSSVTSIGSFAFYGCTALTEVIFSGNGLISIGAGSFAGCSLITSLNLPDSVTSIGEYAFAGIKIDNNADESVIIGENSLWKTNDTWVNTDMALSEVAVNTTSKLSTISDYAFYNLLQLSTITLSKSLSSINYLAFADSGLISANVYSGGNYMSDNGGIYSSDGKTFCFYPQNGAAAFILRDGTTAIGENAFYKNKTLEDLTINASLLRIGKNAFYGAKSLHNITFEDNSLLSSINDSAFENCKALTSLILPSTVTSIGSSVFKNASNLIAVDFNGALITSVPQYAFYGCNSLLSITIPKSAIVIGTYAFYGCSELVTLSFATNSLLSDIDSYAFADCLKLTAVTLPDSIKKIAAYAFTGISGKSNFELTGVPTTLQNIGDYAFSNTKLTNFTINNNLNSLGDGVFKNCTGLTRITFAVSDKITILPKETLYGCTALTQISFPYTLTQIEEKALYGCTKLSDITFNVSSLGKGIEDIGESAFENCILLKSGDGTKRILPTTLLYIGDRAFYGCSTITKIYVPAGLSKLSKEAFAFCNKLTSINYDTGTTLTTIGENAFAHCTSLITAALPSSLSARGADNTIGCIKNPFIGCSSLIAFTISDNPNFSITNGVVYQNTSDGKIVYLYPTGKNGSFSIEPNICGIDNYAFFGTDVTALTFNHNITISGVETITFVKIGKYAFAESNLVEASLSRRVNEIDDYAFSNSSLSSLSFESTYITSSNTSFAITNSGATSNVLSIGNYAFSNIDISALSLPTRITSLGNGAFATCYKLATINFSSSDTFSLTIGDKAFYGNNGLINIVLPAQVSNIGEYAFANCYNMQSVIFDINEALATPLSLGAYAFAECHYLYSVSLPKTLSSMGEGIFSHNSRLKYINFPDTINTATMVIPAFAFYGDNALNAISIPSYVTSVGEKAFWKTKLTSVTFANGTDALSIMPYAFAEISTLKDISLPTNLIALGDYAFYRSALENIVYSDLGDNFTIGNYVFYGTNLSNVIISNRVIGTLGDYAFAETKVLETVAISDGIISIGAHSFDGSCLSEITLASTIVSLGDYAFANTSRLNNFSSTIQTIGNYAFYNSAIESFSLPTRESLSVGERAFSNCSNLTALSLVCTENLSVDNYAFAECAVLSTLNLEGSISFIGNGIAYNNPLLTAINVVDNGTAYYTDNGILYHNDGADTVLLQYPAGKKGSEMLVPNTVSSFADFAFYGNKLLMSLVIHANILIPKGTNTFTETNQSLKIYVAEDLVDTYSENWKTSNVSYQITELDGLILKYVGNDSYVIIDYVNDTPDLTLSGYLEITIGDKKQSYRITGIDKNAFANTVTLRNLTIGEGIKEIADYAFYGCSELISANIGNNVTIIKSYAFADCIKLQNVTFGTNLKALGNYAFKGCTVLNDCVLPDSLEIIGDYTFCDTTALQNIIFGNGLKTLGNNTFQNSVNLQTLTLPKSLTSIGNNVFYNCNNLSFVYILSNTVPTIGGTEILKNVSDSLLFFVPKTVADAYKSHSIWGNYSNKIEIIENVLTIPGYTSYVVENIDGNNYRLLRYLGTESNVTLISFISPEIKITAIGGYCFGRYTQNLILSNGITEIGAYAFINAENLASVQIPSSLIHIGNYAFSGLPNLTSLNYFDINTSELTSIGHYAFYNTQALNSFVFSSKITSLGNFAFSGDTMHLSSVTFKAPADKVLSLGDYVFANNVDLRSVTFNCRVSKLGDGAFADCPALESLFFNSVSNTATIIPDDAHNVFINCNKLSVFVKSSTIMNNFKTAWKNPFDANRLTLSSNIAHDIPDGANPVIGQENFVISVLSSSTASIINYLGNDSVVAFPSKVIIDGMTYTITKLGRDENNSQTIVNGDLIGKNVTKVIIPSSVITIGSDAFKNATNLTTVEYSGESAITTIESDAFSGCEKLEAFTIPKTITNIEKNAFYGCISLINLTFTPSAAFSTNVLAIKEYAFANCSALTTVILPVHTYSLGNYSFYNSSSLTSVIIPDDSKLGIIGMYAFGKTNIYQITLPESVSRVNDNCFYDCQNLRYIHLLREIKGEINSLTYASANIFSGISTPFIKIYVPYTSYTSYREAEGWKTKVVIPDLVSGEYNYFPNSGTNTVTLTNYLGSNTVLQIPESLNVDGQFLRVTSINNYMGNERIEKVVFSSINNYVTSLGKEAFRGCSSLKEITLPNNITSIGDYCFAECSSLIDIKLSQNITSITPYSFYNCTSLEEITLPAGITSLGAAAFLSCEQLSRLIIDFSTAYALGTSALENTSDSLCIIVKNSTSASFMSEWKDYKDNIYERDNMLGDFILENNTSGLTLVQYNGDIDIDLTELVFLGSKVTAIAENSLIDVNIKITIDDTITYYSGYADQIIIK